MPRRPAIIRKSDLVCLLSGAKAAGYSNPRVEIEPGGKVVLVAENPPAAPAPEPSSDHVSNPWNEVID